jgi:hypothetical protein
MIIDQTIISARTEIRTNAIKDRRFMRAMIAASIGAALTMPTVAAWGMDSPHARQLSDSQITSDRQAASITLPPVPYIDSIPWMKWDANANAFKTDLLLTPTLQWGIGQTFEPHGNQKLSAK